MAFLWRGSTYFISRHIFIVFSLTKAKLGERVAILGADRWRRSWEKGEWRSWGPAVNRSSSRKKNDDASVIDGPPRPPHTHTALVTWSDYAVTSNDYRTESIPIVFLSGETRGIQSLDCRPFWSTGAKSECSPAQTRRQHRTGKSVGPSVVYQFGKKEKKKKKKKKVQEFSTRISIIF